MKHPHSPLDGTRVDLRRVAAIFAALVLVLVLGHWASRNGTRTIYEDESAFGRVRVVERGDGLRSLYMGAGRARQSALFPERPTHLEIAYTRVATVGLALVPRDGRVLFVGLGGGAMPTYTRATLPSARIDVVEIDPLVVEVARRYFGFRTDSRMAVHTGDGRAFIEQAPRGAYDLIVLDAFSDDEIPYALSTREFLEGVRASLAPGGVVVSNLWSANREYESMLATYDAVFDEMHLVRVPHRAQRILVAAAGDRSLDRRTLLEASRALARRVELGFDLPALIEAGYEGSPAPSAPVREDARDG